MCVRQDRSPVMLLAHAPARSVGGGGDGRSGAQRQHRTGGPAPRWTVSKVVARPPDCGRDLHCCGGDLTRSPVTRWPPGAAITPGVPSTGPGHACPPAHFSWSVAEAPSTPGHDYREHAAGHPLIPPRSPSESRAVGASSAPRRSRPIGTCRRTKGGPGLAAAVALPGFRPPGLPASHRRSGRREAG